MEINDVRTHLNRPADGDGLAVFRCLFGFLMLAATIRFWAYGWIDEIYLALEFHFTYAWFSWVKPLPGLWLYGVFAVMGGAAIGIAIGVGTGWAAATFLILFSYTELIEKAACLNHYYLVSLLVALLVFLPSDGLFTFKTRRKTSNWVPRGAYTLLRCQVGLVYFYAAFAKFNTDWLLHAEPLRTWLHGYQYLGAIGTVLAHPWTAFIMSWAGMVFDLTIWFFVWWQPTRVAAFACAVIFHVTVWLLFPIGIFPWVMLLCITLFFSPSWPRRFFRHKIPEPPTTAILNRPRRLTPLIVGITWVIIQVAVPLRFVPYEGPVNWTEQGFRFAWRVMLIEKTGMLEYRIEAEEALKDIKAYPRTQLSPLQYKMLTTQPDMIIEYTRWLAQKHQQDGHKKPKDFAESFVSFNGRPAQRYLRNTVDLADPRVGVGDAIMPLQVHAPNRQ